MSFPFVLFGAPIQSVRDRPRSQRNGKSVRIKTDFMTMILLSVVRLIGGSDDHVLPATFLRLNSPMALLAPVLRPAPCA